MEKDTSSPDNFAEDPFGWKKLLHEWSIDLLASNDLMKKPSQEAIDAQWLGYPGATEEQILQAEARLGTRLPPSYRAFLKVTNGWGQTTNFIDKLWSTEEIDWLHVRNQHLIEVWNTNPDPISDEEYFVYGEEQSELTMRGEYLKTALEISDWGDSALYLLNPQVVTPEGEWEAWFFANWYPGAARYRSFWEMMQDEYKEFLRLEG